MSKIVAKGLRVAHGAKVVLRDVDVAAEAGDVLGVLGPSGAGKSTLFRALVGERLPDAGTVTLDDRDVTALPLWQRARLGVGYIPQTPSILWDLTVRENLATYLRLTARPGARGASSASTASPESLAARVELGDRLDVLAGKLSGGERRRLELARALSMAPTVLVCDEPFAGVDPKGAGHIATLLQSLAKDGVAVVLADHHVEEALAICTRAVLLLDGAIGAEGSPEEFTRHPLVRGRYLGTLRPDDERGNLADPHEGD